MSGNCPNCGAQVADNMRFCTTCGTKVDQQPIQPPSPVEPQPVAPPPYLQPNQQHTQEQQYPQGQQYPPEQQYQPNQQYPQGQQHQQGQQYQPYQQYQQGQQYMQGADALPPKKRRIPLIVKILIAIAFIGAIATVVALLVTGSVKNKDFIKIGKDEVPTVKHVLGVTRDVKGVSTSIENGVTKKTIEYRVPTNSSAEMREYARGLHDDFGYMHIKENDFSAPVGRDIELAKESVQEGFIVIVRIDYDRSGYTVTLTRGEGTLTVYDKGPVHEVPPLPPVSAPSMPESPSTKPPSPDPIEESPPATPESEHPTIELPVAEGQLLSSYIDVVSSKAFYMNMRTKVGDEADDNASFGEGLMDMNLEIAKQGEETAMIMKDYGMHVIIRDGKSYVIMHDMKMVMVTEDIGTNLLEGSIAETDDLVFKGTGSGTLIDSTLPYEAYSSRSNPNAETRFFADGKRLAGIQYLQGGQVTVSTEIFEMSQNVPPGMFDIPTDYVVTGN